MSNNGPPGNGDNTTTPSSSPSMSRNGKGYNHAIAGSLSGIISCAIAQPFDTVKTRMIGRHSSHTASDPQALYRRTGTLQSMRYIVKQDGWRGLWYGTVPSVVRVGPGAGVYYFFLNQNREWLLKWKRQRQQIASDGGGGGGGVTLSNFENMIVGGAARGIGTVIVNPITVVKTRFEFASAAGVGADSSSPASSSSSSSSSSPASSSSSSSSSSPASSSSSSSPASSSSSSSSSVGVARIATRQKGTSIMRTLVDIHRTEGIARGLFSGLVPTLARDMPQSALNFMFFMQFKKMLSVLIYGDASAVDIQHSSLYVTAPAGALGGIISTLVTVPFDVVRTRLQLKSDYKSMTDGFVRIWADEGVKGLFRGVVPRVAKRGLASALSWTMYEQLVKLLNMLNPIIDGPIPKI